MFDSLPKVALLGRPNVGKSTLFNRLIRSNRAITHDRPGVTRDRMEGTVQIRGQKLFTLIDTGGVTLEGGTRVAEGPEALRGFEEAILSQAREAVREAAVLCLVVDARDGLTPFDRHLADFLRKQDKPLLLVINKVDGPEKVDVLSAEFHELGFDIFPCSAEHGFNIRALVHEFVSLLEDGTLSDKTEAIMPELPSMLIEGATKRQKKKLIAGFSAEALAASHEEELEPLLDEPVTGISSEPEAEPVAAPVCPEAAASGAPGLQAETFDEEVAVADTLTDAGMHEGLSAMDEEAALEAELAAAEAELALQKQQGDEFVDGIPAVIEEEADYSEGPLRMALLGRPNAGKSSLVNALVGVDRMIVSDVPGTTRDSVDVVTTIDGEPCIFVDTAGVRRRARITDIVERYSVNSSIKSTTKAHVTLLLLDGTEGVTQQDKRLIDLLHERKTPFMVLVNKCDTVEKKERKNFELNFKDALSFCSHVPLLFISALKRQNIGRIVALARSIREECHIRIPTGQLNRAMEVVLARHQPPVVKRVRAKFFYMTQAESAPPTFVFFVNNAEKILSSYARYLERSLRKLFSINYAPMRIHFRSSHTKKKR